MTPQSRKGRRLAVLLLAGLLGLLGSAAPLTAANATVPRCTASKYYTFAIGGCNGNGTPGRDRMNLECKGPWAYMHWVSGPWHDRYADWQDYLHCNSWETAYYITFDHQG